MVQTALDHAAMDALVSDTVRDRHLLGVAAGVVVRGEPVYVHTRGPADAGSGRSVTAATVFRVASISKTFTAIALMQLVEQGLVELDRPANEYLRSVRVYPRDRGAAPVLVRHLLTHTSGLGERKRDLLGPGRIIGRRSGHRIPSLTEIYGSALQTEVPPGTKWSYSNDGYAILGQLVEDVVGRRFADHVREAVFRPLAMMRSSFDAESGASDQAAVGHRRRDPPRAVPYRNITRYPAGGAFSTIEDMLLYGAALAGGGANRHGRVLRSDTVASMYQSRVLLGDRVPFFGVSFFLGELGGHPIAYHGGDLPGWEGIVMVAPADEAAVVVLANRNGCGGTHLLAGSILGHVLGLPTGATQTVDGAPVEPRLRAELAGVYRPAAGFFTNLRVHVLAGGRLTVAARDGGLFVRGRFGPLRRSTPLIPVDPADPLRFRIMLRGFPLDRYPVDVVFTRASGGPVTRMDLGVVGARLDRAGSTAAGTN